MKKALIGLVALIVIIAGVIIVGTVIRKGTAEKAGDMVYKIFSELDIYNWDYESATLLGNSLVIKELLIEDEIFIKELKISKIKEEADQVSANISIKGLDTTEDHSSYFRADRITIKDFVLAARQYDDPIFRSFGDFEIHNLRFREYGEGINIGSIVFKGKFSMPFDSLDLDDILYWAMNFDYSDETYELAELRHDFSMKGFSFMIDAWTKPFEIQSFTSTSRIKGNSIVQDFNVEAKGFFTLTADALTTFSAEGDEVRVADMEFVEMNFTYTEKGFVEFIFQMIVKSDSNGRENLARDLIEYGGEAIDYIMENGETFITQFVEFILKPEKITLSLAPSEPLPYLNFTGYMTSPGKIISMMNMTITFNKNEPFPLVFTPEFLDEVDSYYDYNYGYDFYDDYDYERTVGGMVVNLLNYDWGYDLCTFTSVYSENDEPIEFYCDEDAGDFFENNRGPFYIEYSDEGYLTYYDVDDGEYSDWYDDYGYDSYDGYDYSEPVAGFHMNYITSADSGDDILPYLCIFTPVGDNYMLEFYCDEENVNFFESEEGPFFVEFSGDDIITGYDTDPTGELYEEWDDRG